jgi:hypothetical protein
MKLPDITPKQQEILKLLYRYRFLNRIQIQALRHHKDYRRINAWLKDLTDKQYINRIYSTHFLEKTKPAIYYLGINGIRYLKPLTYTDGKSELHPSYPPTELRKRYRENERSEGFRTRSMCVAESCIRLQEKNGPRLRYSLMTQATYAHPEHGYHFLTEAEGIEPSLCILKHVYAKGEDITGPGTITNYLLEIFDPTTPRYSIRYRIGKYIDYLKDDEWDSGDNDPPPITLLVLPRLTDLIYAKRRAKKVIDDKYYWEDDDEERPHLRFATLEQLQEHGITAKIWEEGRKLYDV